MAGKMYHRGIWEWAMGLFTFQLESRLFFTNGYPGGITSWSSMSGSYTIDDATTPLLSFFIYSRLRTHRNCFQGGNKKMHYGSESSGITRTREAPTHIAARVPSGVTKKAAKMAAFFVTPGGPNSNYILDDLL